MTTLAMVAPLPLPTNHGITGSSAPSTKHTNDSAAACHGDGSSSGSTPSSSRACTASARLGVAHHLGAAVAAVGRLHAVTLVHGRQLALLGLGVGLRARDARLRPRAATSSFWAEMLIHSPAAMLTAPAIAPAMPASRTTRGVQPAAGEADHQQHVRREPVAHAEDGGTGQAARDLAVAGMGLGAADDVATHAGTLPVLAFESGRVGSTPSVQTWGSANDVGGQVEMGLTNTVGHMGGQMGDEWAAATRAALGATRRCSTGCCRSSRPATTS